MARYEPVGNIDGLFVTNVRRRGHERNALEPMIFESDVKYRFKVEGRRSFRMSWEIEGKKRLFTWILLSSLFIDVHGSAMITSLFRG